MSLASHAHFDLPERQAAFVGLLTRPLVTPAREPELHALITRHRRHLDTWVRRAGYRLTSIGAAYRLRRTPLAGTAAVPDGPAPARRELVLALVIAAALEDETADSVTLQSISDATRQLVARSSLAEYDPDRRPHRLVLARAVNRLADLGVLQRRTDRDDLLRAWEDEGSGVGAGFVIDRDALVLLLDPHDLALALSHTDEAEFTSTRGPRLLRLLLETQSVSVAALTEADSAYLAANRSRLAHQAAEMTGGTIEMRSDALLLVLPSEGRYATEATIGFPAVSARAWVALRLLDDAAAHSAEVPGLPGFRRCPHKVVADLVARLHAEAGTRLTRELRDDPTVVRAAAESELREAGLIEIDELGWLLRPAAARYRDADLALPHAGDDGETDATASTAVSTTAGGSGGAPAEPADTTAPSQDSLFGDLA